MQPPSPKEPTEAALAPGEDVFTEADLESSDDHRRTHQLMRVDRGATIIAVTALGLWCGGMIALGACAAPMVFQLTPYPSSGHAMGSAFSRFDSIAMGCGLVLLACEVGRTIVALKLGRRSSSLLGRIRRYGAIFMAAAAAFTGLHLTPGIMELYRAGARRNVGVSGTQLEQLHAQAEMIGKVTVGLAVLLIALHILTLPMARPDDEHQALTPLPPGPTDK